MAETTETGPHFWAFEEENEWEGEQWTVYFEVSDPAIQSELQKLEAIIDDIEGDLPYELYEINELPTELDDGSLEHCEYAEEGEEDCGDCGYCCGSEGYYPPEAIRELNAEVLSAALIFHRGSSTPEEDQDPLYKLGLFS